MPEFWDIAPFVFLAGIALFGLALGNLFARPIFGSALTTVSIIVAALILLSIALMLYLFVCLLAALAVTRTTSAINRLLPKNPVRQ